MILWERINHEENLWLLTEEEMNEVPTGTVLISINGDHKVKGIDRISDDLRFGAFAYGLTPAMAESQGLMDKFIIWKLKS
jgi:hypothetical protein